MPDRQEEKRYDTPTAKVFYRLRDLFIQKGSVFTAKSLKLLPVGIGALVALTLIGLVLYRLSEPVGKGRGPITAAIPSAPDMAKIRREPKPEEKPHWPSDEEVLRRWAAITGPPAAGPAQREGTTVAETPSTDRPADTACGMGSTGMPAATPTAERSRADEPLESSKIFERPLAEEKPPKDRPDYEYVSRLAPLTPGAHPGQEKHGDTMTAQAVSPAEGPAGKGSLYQEVRARLLTRIDTSLPGSLVVAEIARDYDLAGFKIRRGDMLIGKVSALGAKRVSVLFDRWVDQAKQEREIHAQAVDLAGATGLLAKPVDSKLKKGLLYANDRALDYVRAFKGHVSIYNNPAQGDPRQMENKALIVEPNTEFYVIFHAIKKGDARP